MSLEDDVFVELKKEEISELKERFRDVEDECYIYTLLDVAERWYGRGGLTITSQGDAWRQDGSFVAFAGYVFPGVFPYSPKGNYEKICDGLLRTTRLYPDKPIYFLNILENHVDEILKIIQKMGRKVELSNENNFYTMSIEKAKSLEIECPPEVEIRKLRAEHADQMDRVWAHHLENSVDYVRDWLSKNGGYGVFLKETDELVSWVMQGIVGHINLLQTEEKYRGRGYARVMLLQMAKHLAENGHVPVATVLINNVASNKLFRKVGFETKSKSFFLVVGKLNQ